MAKTQLMLDADTRREVIEHLHRRIHEHYVFPEVAQRGLGELDQRRSPSGLRHSLQDQRRGSHQVRPVRCLSMTRDADARLERDFDCTGPKQRACLTKVQLSAKSRRRAGAFGGVERKLP